MTMLDCLLMGAKILIGNWILQTIFFVIKNLIIYPIVYFVLSMYTIKISVRFM